MTREEEDKKINDDEQVFRAEQFKSTGDLTVIRDLHRDLQHNYNAAARKYLNSAKTRVDLALYMNERVDKCTKAYEERMLALGLITRTLTEAERLNVAMISWVDECAVTTEKIIFDEGESCGVILGQVRTYLHYVGTVLGTGALQAVGDLAPLGFSSVAHKEAYDAPLVPYVAQVFTRQEVEDYEVDKNYTPR